MSSRALTIKAKIKSVVDMLRSEIASKVGMESIYAVQSGLAPTFSASVDYAPGDCCMKDGFLFKCISRHDAGAWNPYHFEKTSVTEELEKSPIPTELYLLGNDGKTYAVSVDNGALSADEVSSSSTSGSIVRDRIVVSDKLDTTKFYSISVVDGTLSVSELQGIQRQSAITPVSSDTRYSLVYPQITLSTTDDANDTLSATLSDCAINELTIPETISYVRLTFPPKVDGKSRDLLVRLIIVGESVPEIRFGEANGLPVSMDAADDSWSEIAQGVNLIMFTETSQGT